MKRKVHTITIDVVADLGQVEIEMRAARPHGAPRVHLTNVRRADRRAAEQALAELELGLVEAIEDGLRAALPLTRR